MATPCPLTRRVSQASSTFQTFDCEPTETITSIPELTGIFRDNRPRRPRTSKRSVAWDSTVEIHDDGQMKKRQSYETQLAVAPLPNIYDRPSRPSTLLARPPKRMSIGPVNTTIPGEKTCQLFPIAEAGTGVQDTTFHARQRPIRIKAGSLQNPATRRSTIYLPSDDTTLATIHPGSFSRTRRDSTSSSRKSDLFLEMANADEENPNSTVMLPDLDKMVSRRTSLAAQPRRPALQHINRPMQTQTIAFDIPGHGPGKENQVPEVSYATPKPAGAMKPKLRNYLAPIASEPAPKDLLPSAQALQGSCLSQMPPRRQSSAAPVAAPQRHYSSTSTHNLSRKSLAPISQAPSRKPMRSRFSLFPVISENVTEPQLYQDEDTWLDNQAHCLTQLINALFTEWNRCTENITLSPRQKVLDIYQNAASVLLHKRLEASLRFGALQVPASMITQLSRLEIDQAMKKRFLNIFLRTYDVHALQTVAEVVIGREVRRSSPTSRTTSNEHLMADYLTRFVIMHEDSGPDQDSMKNNTVDTEDVAFKRWRRTVLRSLHIIRLLDIAQEEQIYIGRLFQKESPCKSSDAVLSALCKMLLPSVGDPIRVLGHFGYAVKHFQDPIDEYDFQIRNLAIDLRDGVRLAHIIDNLFLRPSLQHVDQGVVRPKVTTEDLSQRLCARLKLPCTSRAQKLINVKMVLTHLGNIPDATIFTTRLRPEDIVDGHREKTTELLWGLIGHWGLPALVDVRLLSKEIRRLEGSQSSMYPSDDAMLSAKLNFTGEPTFVGGDSDHLKALKAWCRSLCDARGIKLTNFSTSFSDRRVFDVILQEYYATLSTTRLSDGCALTAPMALKQLGCSQAFVGLFEDRYTIPSEQTVVSLLGYLAARLLPSAVSYFAARAIQRTWRRAQSRAIFRRRLILARLAHDCAKVVETQQRLLWAASTIQRKWKKICWL